METETESTPRQDQEEDKLISDPQSQTMTRRKICICVIITIAVIMGLGLLILILALTVFKAKNPEINVNSVSLQDLDFGTDLSRLTFSFNVSLGVDVSVRNPNRVGFKYNNSTAFLRYKGTDVGQVPLAANEIGARETRDINLTLTVMADRLLSNLSLYSDVVAGSLPFQTHVRISGKVKILFVKIHVVSYTTCDVEVYTRNTSVSDPTCHYKTKL